MKKAWYGQLAALLAVVGILAVFTACTAGSGDTVKIESVGEGLPARTTVAARDGQMTIYDVMAVNAVKISWSRLSNYEHTLTSGTSAVFPVSNTFGDESVLTVEFDLETDLVTRADWSYQDMTVSILTPDNTVLEPILSAILETYDEKHAETEATQ